MKKLSNSFLLHLCVIFISNTCGSPSPYSAIDITSKFIFGGDINALKLYQFQKGLSQKKPHNFIKSP